MAWSDERAEHQSRTMKVFCAGFWCLVELVKGGEGAEEVTIVQHDTRNGVTVRLNFCGVLVLFFCVSFFFSFSPEPRDWHQVTTKQTNKQERKKTHSKAGGGKPPRNTKIHSRPRRC